MKLTLLAVGDKMPDWAETATAEFIKRLPRETPMRLVTVKPEKRSGQSSETLKSAEATRLLEKIPPGNRIVALDEHGDQITTRQLADKLSRWLSEGKDTVFVIGGADGLAPNVLAQADAKLGLSRLTLPHALARVLLAEQIYRAFSLLNNHPYHRE